MPPTGDDAGATSEDEMDLGDLGDKAKGLLEEHADQVDDAVDKAADLIDDKTGGRFGDQIDAVADKVKDALPGGDA